MSSDEVAISVRNVSKHYLMFDRPEHRLKQMIVPRLQRVAGLPPAKYYRNFAALEDVSFEVKRGETVGIVGRNGSGKSTMLQVVCGTLNPTHGSVTVNGRIAALLELGAGFNPEFTGRENVYLNAAILGMNRHQVDERFDDIARFADIGQFINQPVKTYSSGMYVRLAFATAINVDPDILVVDEALAVGDEAFRRKCYARIEEIQDRGGTILFVSHGAQTIVQLCSRAILFDAGEVILEGEPRAVVSQYQRLINASGDEARKMREEIRAMDASMTERPKTDATAILVEEDEAVGLKATPTAAEEKLLASTVSNTGTFVPNFVSNSTVEYDRRGAAIRDVKLVSSDGNQVNILELGQRYTCTYFVDFTESANSVVFGMQIGTIEGFGLAGANNQRRPGGQSLNVVSGQTCEVKFDFVCRLKPGTYLVTTGVVGSTPDGETRHLHRILDALIFRVALTDTGFDVGYLNLDTKFSADLCK